MKQSLSPQQLAKHWDLKEVLITNQIHPELQGHTVIVTKNWFKISISCQNRCLHIDTSIAISLSWFLHCVSVSKKNDPKHDQWKLDCSDVFSPAKFVARSIYHPALCTCKVHQQGQTNFPALFSWLNFCQGERGSTNLSAKVFDANICA